MTSTLSSALLRFGSSATSPERLPGIREPSRSPLFSSFAVNSRPSAAAQMTPGLTQPSECYTKENHPRMCFGSRSRISINWIPMVGTWRKKRCAPRWRGDESQAGQGHESSRRAPGLRQNQADRLCHGCDVDAKSSSGSVVRFNLLFPAARSSALPVSAVRHRDQSTVQLLPAVQVRSAGSNTCPSEHWGGYSTSSAAKRFIEIRPWVGPGGCKREHVMIRPLTDRKMKMRRASGTCSYPLEGLEMTGPEPIEHRRAPDLPRRAFRDDSMKILAGRKIT